MTDINKPDKCARCAQQDRQSEIDLLKSDIVKYRARIRELESGEHVQFMALKNKKEEVEELQGKAVSLQDEINQLRTALKEVADWISADERLPGFGERVLTLCEKSESYCVNYLDALGLWRDASCAEHRGVTHWRYIDLPLDY